VARLRRRGHKLEEIREATKQGRLAYGFLEDMFPDRHSTRTLEDAAEATGLQPALIERFWTSLGLPGQGLENLTVHQRFLSHYIEQDVVGHMEIEMDPDADLGRVRVAIAFCDLAGYTRYTEEGPSPTGRWATSCCSPSGPSRASASTTAQRCTATATTSGGRSTWPPGSSRAPAGARFL